MGAIWREDSVGADRASGRLRSIGCAAARYYIAFHEGLKRHWAPVFFAAMFVYLGAQYRQPPAPTISGTSAGFVCKDQETDPDLKAPTRLLKPGPGVRTADTQRVIIFKTNRTSACRPELCSEGRESYKIDGRARRDPWSDSGVHIPLGGFSAQHPPIWYQRIF